MEGKVIQATIYAIYVNQSPLIAKTIDLSGEKILIELSYCAKSSVFIRILMLSSFSGEIAVIEKFPLLSEQLNPINCLTPPSEGDASIIPKAPTEILDMG